MGSWDRDYMRERARARARKPKGLETLLEAPFALQSKALMLMLLGFLLASKVPMSILKAFAPRGPIVVDPSTMYMEMTSRGFLGGVVAFLPAIRLLGLLLIGVSGWAMIQRRKRYGYNDILTDPRIGVVIGIVCLGFVGTSIWNDGFWKKQALVSQKISRQITTGTEGADRTRDTARVVERSPVLQNRVVARAEPDLPAPDLTPDRPFPANGTITRTLPLTGKVSSMSFLNRTQNNAIVIWFYNLNDDTGDKEALRLYLTAGQSAIVRLPSFDYRMAMYQAPANYGLDKGFGRNAQMNDLGFVDLKTPDTMLSKTPSVIYMPFVGMQFTPGVYARR